MAVCLLLAGLAVFWSGSVLAKPGTKAPVVLKVGSVVSDNTPWATMFRTFAEGVEKDAKGEVAFEYGFGGSYGGEYELVKLCQQGKVDLIGVSTTIVANILPELNILEMPYLFHNYGELDFAVGDILDEEIGKRLKSKGLEILMWTDNGYKNIATVSKAVRSPDDMKGLSFRSQQSDIYEAIFTSLGSRVVPLSVREVAQGLQVGMIDGFDNSALFVYSSGFYHYVKYYTLTEHTYQSALMLMSKKMLDGKPESFREIVHKHGRDVAKMGQRMIRDYHPKALKAMEEGGVQVIRLDMKQKSAFMQATESVYQDSERLLGKEGAKLLNKVRQALEKRRQFLRK